MYSHNYDNDYDPSAPVAEISIRKTERNVAQSRTFTALVDSGADATMIPLSHLSTIGAPLVGTSKMRGVTGQRQDVQLFLVVVQIGQYTATGIQAVAISDHDEPIVGRDVLNQFIVILNGPGEVLELGSANLPLCSLLI